MGRRQQFQTLLETLGAAKVYFQAPSEDLMVYPCFVYKRDFVATVYADNSPYKNTKRYQVTAIDRNPDSDLGDKLAELPMSSFQRSFAKDGLNHDVYQIYF